MRSEKWNIFRLSHDGTTRGRIIICMKENTKITGVQQLGRRKCSVDIKTHKVGAPKKKEKRERRNERNGIVNFGVGGRVRPFGC